MGSGELRVRVEHYPGPMANLHAVTRLSPCRVEKELPMPRPLWYDQSSVGLHRVTACSRPVKNLDCPFGILRFDAISPLQGSANPHGGLSLAGIERTSFHAPTGEHRPTF